MSSNPQVLAFQTRIRRLLDVWNGIEVRYSVISQGSLWVNLWTRLLLTPSSVERISTKKFVDLPWFRAGQFPLPTSALEPFLSRLPTESVTLGEQSFDLWTPTQGFASAVQSRSLYGWTFLDEGPDEGPTPRRSAYPLTRTLTLLGNGGPLGTAAGEETWTALERCLLDLDPPYFGFRDLSRWFLKSDEPMTRGHLSTLKITAPLYARFEYDDELEFDETSGDHFLRLDVPATIQPAELKIAVQLTADHTPTRELYRLSEKNESSVEGGKPSLSRKLIQRVNTLGANWLDARLIFRGEVAAALSVDLPRQFEQNPRVAALRNLGEGYGKLSALLGGDPGVWRERDRAEMAVSWLFTTCGFQVFLTDFGKVGMAGATPGGLADLVFFVPSTRNAAIVEVTSQDIMIEGKLVKLLDRKKALQDEIEYLDVQVLPAICTGKESITRPEREQANQLGIAVLTRAVLAELMAMADDNRPPRECFGFIAARIETGNP